MSDPAVRPALVVAVASGKGGTGKTTVAVNLAVVAAARGLRVQLADCDVEEPNAQIFVKARIEETTPVALARPKLDAALCTGCGKCAAVCEFNAIACINGRVVIFDELCHGCGACWLICPENALTDEPRNVGVIESGSANGFRFIQGRVEIGEAAASPPIVRAVRASLGKSDLAIIDAPPGTTCPMVAAVNETGFVCLVTEPTPFGLHDLTIAVETVRELDVPMGVVINRADIGDDRVQRYCADERIPILGEIPHNLRIAQAYSRGDLIVEALPEFAPLFKGILARIERAAVR
ncbi:MAG: ATP-binding protein [Verrucomicrobia bacterium]|nr:ATP-binding protein [Verrucomicrobiota bacterium]